MSKAKELIKTFNEASADDTDIVAFYDQLDKVSKMANELIPELQLLDKLHLKSGILTTMSSTSNVLMHLKDIPKNADYFIKNKDKIVQSAK